MLNNSQKKANMDFEYPMSNDELQKLCTFLNNHKNYEYVNVSDDFVEFGSSAGAYFMYYALNENKPEAISKNYKIYDFGDGWYFSMSIGY